uniref:BHLH domain-containing protein n=1 Tax=Timema cristinae TaxID=61476 RepID=A0A7R9CEX3_TIMCR|nr:unnamed protein product [Timema cristinae]
MTTMGVVNFTNLSPHSKLPILQHSADSGVMMNERREIIILRKKSKPLESLMVKKEPVEDLSCQTTVLISNNNNNNNNIGLNGSGAVRAKRKSSLSGNLLLSRSHQPPPQAVARRNARERNRVKQVNNGFATLRQHIPVSLAASYTSSGESSSGRGGSKKLSKVETLRMAVDYIRSLQRLLSMDDNEAQSYSMSTPTNSPDSSTNTLMPESPLSPNDSSKASTHQPHYVYDDDRGHCEMEASPILIDDEDLSSMDPTSPSPSIVSGSSPYHRVQGSNSLIQLVNTPPDDLKNYPETHQYTIDETNLPSVTSSFVRTLGNSLLSGGPFPHLQQTQALISVDGDVIYPEPSQEELRLLSTPAMERLNPQVPSQSPNVYSDQSLSPIRNAELSSSNLVQTQQEPTSTSMYLPTFLSALKSSSMQHLSSVIHRQQDYNGLHIPIKKEVEEGIVGDNSGVIDMMTWWEHEQRLREHQPTTTTS